MDALVKGLFESKLREDHRTPVWSLRLSESTTRMDVLAPNYEFFVQIIVILAMQMLLGCIMATILYFGIVRPRRQGRNHHHHLPSTSSSSLLLGYGLVIPVTFWLPFVMCDWLDIRCVTVRMGWNSFPLTITLRCLEAMHNHHDSNTMILSWQDYLRSVGMILLPRRDGKGRLQPLTWQSFGNACLAHLQGLGLFCVLYHLLMLPFDGYPFGHADLSMTQWISFHPAVLYNTFLQAALLNLTLSFSLSGVACLASLLSGGIDYDFGITHNPMFRSRSPSDFWGRRWNQLIHTGLKRGVYRPLLQRPQHSRRSATAAMAAFAVFVMSGLLHEYVWALLFFPTTAQLLERGGGETTVSSSSSALCCPTCYCHARFGKQLVLFGWNGLLLVLEYSWLGQRLATWGIAGGLLLQWPRLRLLLQSHLVVLLSLPVGHLFTADMVNAGYFVTIEQAMPMIRVYKM